MAKDPEALGSKLNRRNFLRAIAASAIVFPLTACDNGLPLIGDTIPEAKGRDGLELNGVAHETLRGVGADLASVLESNGGASRSPDRYDNSDSGSCVVGEVAFNRMENTLTVQAMVYGSEVSITYVVGKNNENIQGPSSSLTIDAIRSALNDKNTEAIAFKAEYSDDGELVSSSMSLNEGSQAQVVVGGKNITQPTDTRQQRSAALNMAISHLKVASETISNTLGNK